MAHKEHIGRIFKSFHKGLHISAHWYANGLAGGEKEIGDVDFAFKLVLIKGPAKLIGEGKRANVMDADNLVMAAIWGNGIYYLAAVGF
jgi:hypothetical protein